MILIILNFKAIHLGGWKEIKGPIDEETVPWRENERYFKGELTVKKFHLIIQNTAVF